MAQIVPEAYQDVVEEVTCHGPIALAEVQLCRMAGRLPGQYYPVEASVALCGSLLAQDYGLRPADASS